MKSMTGYGRAHQEDGKSRCTVEVYSVNRKGLEMTVFLPKELLMLDIDIRKCVQQHVFRGQVTIRVQFEMIDNRLQIEMLGHLKSKWEKIARSLGYPPESCIDLPFLMNRATFLSEIVDEKRARSQILATLEEALSQFLLMRGKEGITLKKEMTARMAQVTKTVEQLLKIAPKIKQKNLERLRKKLIAEGIIDQETLQKEEALFAVKTDFTEEIVRFKSHLAQMKEGLDSRDSSIGRKLDFLVQEMGREINTLCVKASDEKISQIGIDVKSEIEKIREQLQNIE